MLELYHSGTTTCSKQVRQQLVEKAIPYTSRYVELWSYQNLTPEYLGLNPNGVVPTLVHDDRPIINSFCIMEYIEDVFPERPLRPVDPRLRAKQRHWSWVADEVHPSIANATYAQLMRERHRALDDATVEAIAARMPVPERRERFLRAARSGFAAADVAESWERIEFVLAQFEDALPAGAWTCGDHYSLADISMLAIVSRASSLRPDAVARHERLADWLTRSLLRPAVRQVYAEGTVETPKRPGGVYSVRAAE